ncbi:NAD(P)-dependent alcohol dehydrogenase [Peribacillus frigoritolerans]|uniref:NAD(P)-dependent alcohol dehydrogenase n=1 Tax=Peribacillus frigoritolerans TaxID=450367 RepID=UPI003D2C9C43
MKAIVYTKYGPPDVLHLKEVEKPDPKEYEILIKVKAASVTMGDIRSRSFTVSLSVWLPARIIMGLRRPKKTTLGLELSEEVESVGKDVNLFKAGDQIFAASQVGYGAYAEYNCMRKDGPVSIKPNNISFEEAAAIPIGARTALFYLRKANVQSGQKVLVYGASGSVGSYAVQIAMYFGAKVTGVCSTANVELVKSLGADKVIDYTSEDFSRDGENYDVIFEAVNKSPFSASMISLKKEGTYLNVTVPVPGVRMLWTKLTTGNKLILSQNSPETPEALNFLKELVEAGKLKVIIDRCYAFEELVQAHRYVEKGHKKGKVVITMEKHNGES